MRVNIIGTSGSGKTTFGKKLADVIDHPFVEMDAVYWGPNWTMPSEKEFFQRLRKILLTEDWVLDGNYTRTLDYKWDRVQAVVWLHFSFPRTVYQAIKRALTRLFDQEELWPGTGNRENIKMLFSRDSIVWYTISNYHRHAKRNFGYLQDARYNHIKFHHIRSLRQADLFLEKVEGDPSFLIEERK